MNNAADAFDAYFKANPALRWGQAFCNFFNLTDSELFYCDDRVKAERLACQNWYQLYMAIEAGVQEI